jgi:ferredoxin-NADP reductase
MRPAENEEPAARRAAGPGAGRVVSRPVLRERLGSARVTVVSAPAGSGKTVPPGWTGYSGRVDAALLAKIAWPASEHPLAFICGPTSFVEVVAGNLVALGYPAGRVKTERFGGA